jgi:transposase
MLARFFGFDIHKKYVVVAAVDAKQEVIMRPTRVSMAHLADWAADHLTPENLAVLEVGSNAWAVMDMLSPYVGQLIAADPYKTKLIAEARIKNDKVDALVLAQLLAASFIPEVWVPDQQVRERRGLAVHRATLQKQCTQVKNRIHQLLTKHNVCCPENSVFSSAGRRWLLSVTLPQADDLQRRHLLCQLDMLQKELDDADRLIARLASQDGRIPYLMQLTGINYYTAFTILAAIGYIERFARPHKLAAYGGLVPRQHQSGTRDFHGHITKAGNSLLRWLTVEAARAAIRWDPHWRQTYQRIARRRGSHIAVVAIARKLLVLVWHLLTKKDIYRYLQAQTFVTKLQNWASRIGHAHLPATSTKDFVIAHLTALGLHHLAASLVVNKKGQLRVQSA